MRPSRRLRWWVFENRFKKRALILQHDQVGEHRQILADMRACHRGILHDLADEVLRLTAVSDQLETALEEMAEDEDER